MNAWVTRRTSARPLVGYPHATRCRCRCRCVHVCKASRKVAGASTCQPYRELFSEVRGVEADAVRAVLTIARGSCKISIVDVEACHLRVRQRQRLHVRSDGAKHVHLHGIYLDLCQRRHVPQRCAIRTWQVARGSGECVRARCCHHHSHSAWHGLLSAASTWPLHAACSTCPLRPTQASRRALSPLAVPGRSSASYHSSPDHDPSALCCAPP
eukprot:2835669-Prymnesium_polylepis.2